MKITSDIITTTVRGGIKDEAAAAHVKSDGVAGGGR